MCVRVYACFAVSQRGGVETLTGVRCEQVYDGCKEAVKLALELAPAA